MKYGLADFERAICVNALIADARRWEQLADDSRELGTNGMYRSLANDCRDLSLKFQENSDGDGTALLHEMYDALNLLLQDVEDVACGVNAYGMPVENEEHPFHESVLKARKVLSKLRG